VSRDAMLLPVEVCIAADDAGVISIAGCCSTSNESHSVRNNT